MRPQVAILALALATGCRDRAPETVLFLSGRVVTDSGEPVPNLQVSVSATHCGLVPEHADRAQREQLTTVESDADGRYEIELFQVQREGKCLYLTTLTDPHAGGSELLIDPLGLPRYLPDLVIWDAQVHVLDGEDAQQFQSPTAGFASGDVETARSWTLVDAAGRHAWFQPDTGESFAVSPAVREEFVAGIRSEIVVFRPVPSEYYFNVEQQLDLLIRVHSWSRTLPLPASALRPVSRGAACSFSGEPQVPCPATDGDVRAVVMRDSAPWSPGQSPIHAESLRIDFGREVSPRRVVIRAAHEWRNGLSVTEIEVSPDGVNWSGVLADRVSARDGDAELLLSDAGSPVRYLRIVSQTLSTPSLVREVSVFEE